MKKLTLSPQDGLDQGLTRLAQSLEQVVQTYSNVHRGTGAFSLVSTALYEHSRQVILAYLKLDRRRWQVIFCSPARAERWASQLPANAYHMLTSRQLGLPLGLVAVAVRRTALPSGHPFETGGGTIKLVSPGWVVWADAPDRFEAGTPPIINAILLACATRLAQSRGEDALRQELEQSATSPDMVFEVLPAHLEGTALLAFLRQGMAGSTTRVPGAVGQVVYANLDNAASKPALGPVVRTFWRALALPTHDYAAVVAKVNTICARFLGAIPEDYEVIFTSNTSEAINLVARSLSVERLPKIQPLVVNSLLDHHSNELPWRYLPGIGHLRLEVGAEGLLDLERLETLLKTYNQEQQYTTQRIILVALCGASNVIGSVNELAPVSVLVHRYGARLLVDAAQLVAHRKIDLADSQVDYLAFSAHKVYAPFGSGALVVRRGLLSADQLERMQRSGEENVAGIAALGEALLCLERVGMQTIEVEEKKLTSRLVGALQAIPGIQMYGITDRQSPVFDQRSGSGQFSPETGAS